MTYIILNSNGKYVAHPGLASSFTRDPHQAYAFKTLEAAQANCCGNEHPVDFYSAATQK